MTALPPIACEARHLPTGVQIVRPDGKPVQCHWTPGPEYDAMTDHEKIAACMAALKEVEGGRDAA